MSLMNKNEVLLLLNQLELRPNKRLGQNFLIDKNVIDKIIALSDLSLNDVILEIGPGLGSLTEKIATQVKKIYAVEIDSRLHSYLKNKFSTIDNIEVINGDILEIDIPFHNKTVSNIPYKITGPILEKIFFKKNPPQGILTIVKSIADRIFLSGEYKNISRISIGVNTFMNPLFKKTIPRTCFYPIPKIENTLIKLVPKEKIDPFFKEEISIQYYLKFIAGIMPYKNKNIVNALNLFFKANYRSRPEKSEILRILKQKNYYNKKLFLLNIKEFTEISKIFYNFIR